MCEELSILSDPSVLIAALFSAIALMVSGAISAFSVIKASKISMNSQRVQNLETELIKKLTELAEMDSEWRERDEFFATCAHVRMLIDPNREQSEALLTHLEQCELQSPDDFSWWQQELLNLSSKYIHGDKK